MKKPLNVVEKILSAHLVKVYRGEREKGDPATCFYEKWSDYGWDPRGMWTPQCKKGLEGKPCVDKSLWTTLHLCFESRRICSDA